MVIFGSRLRLWSQRITWAMLVCSGTWLATSAEAEMFEDFDGGGTNAYSLTSSSGTAPSVLTGGPSGSYLRVVSLTASNNNSIAFDENLSVTGPAPKGKILSFDFRMSGDADNTAAGGCCDSAADGLGIGYHATPRWGATGPMNPGAAGAPDGADWERPAFARAVTIGLDVFEKIDVVTLNAFGSTIAEVDVKPFLDLNNGLFHRGILTVLPNPANTDTALFDFDIIEDVHGAAISHKIMDDILADNVNLNGLPANRIIAGGRTGGAFVNGDFDNISVRLVPEPASLTLLVMAGIPAIGLLRRRSQAV